MVQIENIEFEHICEIVPNLDSQGKAIEFFPQERYENRKKLSLNKYGEGPFCKFSIDKKYARKSGVYIIKIDENIQYVGECNDFQKRFGMGYGNISPKNCFEGGQPTNCRVNSDILKMFKAGKEIQLYFLETKDRFEIEHKFIKKLKPIWNKTIGKPSKIS